MNKLVRALKKYRKALTVALREWQDYAPEPNEKQKNGPVCDVCLTEVGLPRDTF